MAQEKRYGPKLSIAEVDGYWQLIGMTQTAWMSLSENKRVELAWTDMLARQGETQRLLEDARELRGDNGSSDPTQED